MASYQHEWQCIYCGKRICKSTNNQNPVTPMFPGYCPSNPSGNPKSKHVVQKMK